MTNIERLEQFLLAKAEFGYTYDFHKDILVWGKTFNLEISFEVFDDKTIEEVQVSQFQDFYLNQDKYYGTAKEQIIKYLHSRAMRSLYSIPTKLPEDIFEYVTPIGIYVSHSIEDCSESRLGLTFDCHYVGDVGICVAFKSGNFNEINDEELLYIS